MLVRLRPLVFASLLSACGSELVDTDVRLALSHSGLQAQALTSTGAATCDASATACTPANLSGRIFSANAMWGPLGPEAFGITMLGATPEIIEDPSSGLGAVLEFSLIEATVLGGQYAAPGGGSEAKAITRMEFNYDYLDAAFAFDAPGSPLDGAWVVRTVFATMAEAPDVRGVMLRGDKLIRRADATVFTWCGASGCAEERDAVEASLVVEAKLVEYVDPGQGNPNYIPFTVPVMNDLELTGDDLSSPGAMWSAAFDMNGAILLHTPASELNGPAALLNAFELSYEPDQQNAGEETSISVDLQFLR